MARKIKSRHRVLH